MTAALPTTDTAAATRALATALGRPQLADDLARVEAKLHGLGDGLRPGLADQATHYARAGGKRLRPALVLLAAAVDDRPASAPTVAAAVAVEALHLGSLVHDDLMDHADTRRGVASVNRRWGPDASILAGDLLLAEAFTAGVQAGPTAARIVADTLRQLVVGQDLEVADGGPGRTETGYWTSIGGKTAALLAASCRLGAVTAGRPDRQVQALATYGWNFGLAFQVIDDILDLVADDDTLGKPAGNDLAEGTVTLPVLRAVAADERAAAAVDTAVRSGDHRDAAAAAAAVRTAGGDVAALADARRLLDDAAAALDVDGLDVPAGPLRRLPGLLLRQLPALEQLAS